MTNINHFTSELAAAKLYDQDDLEASDKDLFEVRKRKHIIQPYVPLYIAQPTDFILGGITLWSLGLSNPFLSTECSLQLLKINGHLDTSASL